MSTATPGKKTSQKTAARKTSYKRILGFTLLFLIVTLLALSVLLPRLINSDYIKKKAIGLIDPYMENRFTAELIRPVIFPRPGLKISGLTFQIHSNCVLDIETAMFFPDLSVLFFSSSQKKPLSGELILKQSKLKWRGGASPPPMPFDAIQNVSVQKLSVAFSYLSSTLFSLNFQGKGLNAALTGDAGRGIVTRNFHGNISKTEKSTIFALTPTTFDSPDMILGTRFQRDGETQSTQLTFTGKHIPVGPVRRIATDIFKENRIVNTLFRIVKGGLIPEISVHFSGKEFLFDPRKMVINATLKQGIIGIPKTRLIVRDVAAAVAVKKGILSPRITGGVVAKARLKKGVLAVDLLDKHHRFNGNFNLTADLAPLPDVLIDLLPDTLLSRELEGTKNIRGTATGTLMLNQSHQGLTVDVQLNDIHVSGRYMRLPGREFDLKADSFTCDNKKITVNGLTGAVGTGHISNLSGRFQNAPSPRLEILSAKGDLLLQSLLPWLNRFPSLTPLVQPWLAGRGHLMLTHGQFKGPLLQPDQWRYRVGGALTRGEWIAPDGQKSITDLSAEFELAPNRLLIQGGGAKITAIPESIQKQKWMLSHEHARALVSDLRLPLHLRNATLEKNGADLSAKGEVTTPTGTVAPFNVAQVKGRTTLKYFTLLDPPRSRATIVWDGSPPLHFSGSLELETVKNLFQPHSGTVAALNIPGIKGDVRLTGAKKGGLSLLLDQVSITPPPKTPLSSSMPHYSGLLNTFSAVKESIPGPVKVRINALEFKHRVFSPLIFTAKTGTDILDVVLEKAQLCKVLAVTGRFQKNPAATTITLSADIRDRQLATTFQCLTGKSHGIEGKFDFKGTLFADRRTAGKKDAPPSLADAPFQFQGPFELIARDGRIFQMTLLSRILSLINVSSLLQARLPDLAQNGFAYEHMICKGKVKNNRILIEKGVINGADMTLALTGWIDPLPQTMELLCFIAPLKTVDGIVRKIPIINTMFKGNIISIPFTLKGDMHDPEVLVMPPLQVTKGLFNTLKDILTTPLTLLEKLP